MARFNSKCCGNPLKVYLSITTAGWSFLSTTVVMLCWSISMHLCSTFCISSRVGGGIGLVGTGEFRSASVCKELNVELGTQLCYMGNNLEAMLYTVVLCLSKNSGKRRKRPCGLEQLIKNAKL